ncbi:MAG: hypothetical protein LUC45_09600 [Paraprevotella sp.]|nr:hypothetical protein [Paraprevotella sp.]
MKFFRKSAPEKEEQQVRTEPSEVPSIPTSVPVPPPASPALAEPEAAARQWFAEKFGTEMPDEVIRMFRMIAQTEIKRQKMGEQVLDANELKRIHDSLRLYKTKLTNTQQTLDGLQAQKEWWHKFKELNGTLEKYRQDFFESNKAYSAHLKEIKELERFETFETVQGNYQRIKDKENMLQGVRQACTAHTPQLTEVQTACKNIQKQEEGAEKKYQDAKSHLRQVQGIVAEGHRLQSTLKLCEDELKDLSAYKEQIEQVLSDTKGLDDEVKGELKETSAKAAQQQLLLQNMESQQRMLEKGDVIQTKLKFLQSLIKRKEQLQVVLERAQKQQHEQDEKLNRLFLSSQEVDAQTNSLQSELQVHQKSVVGMNSYSLQQRAMSLKSKRERLMTAIQLWKQITEGYPRVDDKSQEIMRMKHHNEALKAQIVKLEPEVAGMQTQCEELKYAYTLSKSQDVMRLREDLQEGVSCIVCGATHHPYHSDTLLEQSKLIGEIKIDCEQAVNELKHKQTLLTELKREQALEEGRIEMAYQALEVYKQVLQENVAQWETFIPLDRSFKDCSGSTNFEGRRIMLQQLVEKTGVDAEDAQKELDAFNYHQSSINALNEKIALKEQEKDEIAVRLNEVNTGCQVVAYRVEQLQNSLQRTNNQYSELFDEIDKMMVISNWYKVWTENPENLRIYIQQQMARWYDLKKEMDKTRNERTSQQARQEAITRQQSILQKLCDFVKSKMEQMEESKNQMYGQLCKIFPEGDAESCNKAAFEQMTLMEEEKEKARRQTVEAQIAVSNCQGYHRCLEDTMQELEIQMAAERSDLDVWIRKYNAQHSPVQYSELEQSFNSPTDWNALRLEIRTLTLQNMLAEARANEARLALAAHQVNALSQGQDKEDRTAALNAEIARLESERNRILLQMAGCQARLEAHEAGLQQLTAGTSTSTSLQS